MTRAEGRRRHAGRALGGVPQRPFGQVERQMPPVRVISDDQVAAIHAAALRVLAEQGLRVLHGPARDLFAGAGAEVRGETVRLDAGLLTERLGTVPAHFTLEARNPARNLKVGGGYCVYGAVGGPAYVMCNDKGRRDGSFAEMCDYMRLIQALNVIHQEGGGPFEPLDLPANTRHLDIYHAQIRLVDKSWQTQTLGHVRTMDGIEMAALMLGTTPEGLTGRPVLLGIINTNSPLQLDVPMAEGLIAMATHGQVNVITPFTLAGAMAPVTLAGALVLQHAEAMAGIVLTQIVRPGVPVMYGGFTSNVDMKSGAPAFGTPEAMRTALIGGQLARRYRLPYRSSNVNAANTLDAQAAYETVFSLWGAVMGGVNMLKHGLGWMEGGLHTSFEKFVMDADILQMVSEFLTPVEVNRDSLAMDAIREVGPGGHFFGCAHTQERYRTAFYPPMVSDWRNYESWEEAGSPDAYDRTNALYQQVLHSYRPPPIEPAVAEELQAFVTRRTEEGGAPTDF